MTQIFNCFNKMLAPWEVIDTKVKMILSLSQVSKKCNT